jgi:hypothetical protein
MSSTPPPNTLCACGCRGTATTYNDDWLTAACAARYDNPGTK